MVQSHHTTSYWCGFLTITLVKRHPNIGVYYSIPNIFISILVAQVGLVYNSSSSSSFAHALSKMFN